MGHEKATEQTNTQSRANASVSLINPTNISAPKMFEAYLH